MGPRLCHTILETHDGVFIIKYPPANPKIKSGDHATISGEAG